MKALEVIGRLGWDGPVGFPGVVKDGVGNAVRVINDADAAGLAEMRWGAGRAFSREPGRSLLDRLVEAGGLYKRMLDVQRGMLMDTGIAVSPGSRALLGPQVWP